MLASWDSHSATKLNLCFSLLTEQKADRTQQMVSPNLQNHLLHWSLVEALMQEWLGTAGKLLFKTSVNMLFWFAVYY